MHNETDELYSEQQDVLTRTIYGPNSDITQAVFDTLDRIPGFDPTDVDQTLYEAVDPDALGAVFCETKDSDRSAGRITFPFAGYELTVTAGGEVVVRSLATRSESAAP